MIYFDHNATSPLHPVARQAWLGANDEFPGNPSSQHRLGSRADAALENARADVARLLQCSPTDIIWTAGASEANNTVLHHWARSAAPGRDEVWISVIEHPSVLEPARYYFQKNVRHIPVGKNGVIDVQWVAANLKKGRPLGIAVLSANNETGVLQPWLDLQKMCKEREVPLFCDAVQWVGKLPSSGLGKCDFLSASAHKFGGPKGVGFLKVPEIGRIQRLIHGGPQEMGRRAGTENIAGILAMVAVLQHREQRMASDQADSTGLPELHNRRLFFETEVVEALPDAEIISRSAPRLWNTTMVMMPEREECFRWVVKLDKAGFAVSTGSACSSGQEKPSHVLTSMGYSAAQIARTIRISSGWETTQSDYEALLRALKTLAPLKPKDHL